MKPYYNVISPLPNVMLINGYTLDAAGKITSLTSQRNLLHTLGQILVSPTNTTLLTGGDIMFLRRQLDLNEPELAKLLGVKGDDIYKWELDKKAIDPAAELLLRVLFAQHLATVENTTRFRVMAYLSKLVEERVTRGLEPRQTYYVKYQENIQDWNHAKASELAT